MAYAGLTFAAENEDGTRTVPISPYRSSRWSQLKTHLAIGETAPFRGTSL
jgi:hypothetical protein